MSKPLRLGALLLVLAVFVVAAFAAFDQEGAWERASLGLKTAKWYYFLPMFGMYLLSHLLRSFRLYLLLNRAAAYGRVFVINTLGFLAINVLPFRMGEMVRPYLLKDSEGIPFSRGIAAIFVERIYDLIMLLVMLLLVSWTVDVPTLHIELGDQRYEVIALARRMAIALCLVGFGGMFVVVLIGEPLFKIMERLPLGLIFGSFSRSFREGILGLLRSPMRAIGLLFLSAALWACTIYGIQFALMAFPTLPSTSDVALTVWTVTLAGMTAIPTPGFLLVYELCCAEALKLWGVDSAFAMTFAVILHLGQFTFIASLGLFFSIREGINMRGIAAKSQSVED